MHQHRPTPAPVPPGSTTHPHCATVASRGECFDHEPTSPVRGAVSASPHTYPGCRSLFLLPAQATAPPSRFCDERYESDCSQDSPVGTVPHSLAAFATARLTTVSKLLAIGDLAVHLISLSPSVYLP